MAGPRVHPAIVHNTTRIQFFKNKSSLAGHVTYSCLHVLVHITNQHKFGTLNCNTNFSTTVTSIDKRFVALWLHHLRAAHYSLKT